MFMFESNGYRSDTKPTQDYFRLEIEEGLLTFNEKNFVKWKDRSQ